MAKGDDLGNVKQRLAALERHHDFLAEQVQRLEAHVFRKNPWHPYKQPLHTQNDPALD